MAGYLIAEEGPLAGVTIRLEEGTEWVLGRDPDEVSIVLEDPMVSRRHVICSLTAEGYLLENLSSVNPATQNGKVITESVLLREGDILQIGSTFFRFTEIEPQEALLDQGNEPLHFEDMDDLSSISFGIPSMTRWLLKVISGPNAGAEFNLEKSCSYILGKDPSLSDLIFNDLSVSRQHARITVDEAGLVFIEDLGSRNGILVNGEPGIDKKEIRSQDLIGIGTTSFLLIDREQPHETIISAPPVITSSQTQEAAASDSLSLEQNIKKDWKELVIPKKHIIVAAGFCLVLLSLVASTFSLFESVPVSVHVKHESDQIQEAIGRFSEVQFTWNESTGKLFLLGHVLTSIDKQELLYSLSGLPFITSTEDNIVIDEYVWQNMNALLLSNPSWQMVSIHSPVPGKFVMKGYVETIEQAESLSEYLNINFPYLDRLQNQVVVANNLNLEIQGLLLEQGMSGVTFQITGGELVLAGRVDDKDMPHFQELVTTLKGLPGIRQVKTFVVFTSHESSRTDLSQNYQVSGYSQGSNNKSFVVINGKVLSTGDAIDGMTITNIQATIIFLEKDGLKFRINYNLQ